MRSLKTVLFLILLSGCSMEKFCSERYPPQIKDSTWTKTDTLVKHDTILVPGNIVFAEVTNDSIPKDLQIHSENKDNGLKAILDIRNGKAKCKCEDDSLKLEIEKLQIKTETTREKKEVKMIPCNEEHRTNADIYCRWHTWISSILFAVCLIGYVIIRAFKG